MESAKRTLQSPFLPPLPLVAALALALSGCAAGPDFHVPAAPAAKGLTPSPLPAATVTAPVQGGEAQRFVESRKIPSDWWTVFRCATLEGLVRQALAENPTVAAAEAALRRQEETRRAQIGALFPSVDAGFSANRQRFTGASFGQPDLPGTLFTLYNASVNVSYTLDVFGGTRRGLEALRARVDYQRFLLEGAHLTLASNLVTLAVQEASLRGQLRAAREIIAAEGELAKLIERQFELGAASRGDVLTQQAVLAQSRATLPPLEKALSQARHQLAVLAGKLPAEAGDLPQFELGDLTLPTELPVSLPSDLVRQRPDIRASEELLHEASAQIGVATANLYPRITLTGSLGSQSSALGDLFAPGTSIWNLGAGIVQPVFRGGQLLAERRAALAAFDEARAQYRETVLQAFQNVADVLRALELDAAALAAQAAAEKAARDSLDLVQKEYGFGAASYLMLLTAQRQHEQAVLSLVQAQVARYADTAALFQALGGGWWNREEAAKTAAVKEK